MEETIKKRYQKLMKERLVEEKNQLERKYKAAAEQQPYSLRKQISNKHHQVTAASDTSSPISTISVEQEEISNDSNSETQQQQSKIPVVSSDV